MCSIGRSADTTVLHLTSAPARDYRPEGGGRPGEETGRGIELEDEAPRGAAEGLSSDLEDGG